MVRWRARILIPFTRILKQTWMALKDSIKFARILAITRESWSNKSFPWRRAATKSNSRGSRRAQHESWCLPTLALWSKSLSTNPKAAQRGSWRDRFLISDILQINPHQKSEFPAQSLEISETDPGDFSCSQTSPWTSKIANQTLEIHEITLGSPQKFTQRPSD